MERYVHIENESKWQKRWQEDEVFATSQNPGQGKAYILDMFPYPSGAGLHVGHLLGYTGSDVIARYNRLQGKAVLHPMGWDAFGLPSENFAIKSGVHPAISTVTNIQEYKRQLQQAGMSYDWSKEMATTDPAYYKWTQWLFGLLYKKGLAYRKDGLVNWCAKCQTVLANEQVVHGKCERCDTVVIQKQLKQWYFKITDYAERLLQDLDTVHWPEKIKTMQRNWIGKSEGVEFLFKVQNSEIALPVFTTRPDTIYGVTYMVIAPEHPLIAKVTTQAQKAQVEEYIQVVSKETELERTFLGRKKTGVFSGSYAEHPITKQPVPIWIADYVLASYGTGAVMAVPAHDERDFEFAQVFNLPIIQVISSPDEEVGTAYTGKGTLINSGTLTGTTSSEAPAKIVDLLTSEKLARFVTTYRLRDWLVSRQRFWGSPIPVAYDATGAEYLLPESELPVELPMNVEFLPTGQSPLVLAEEWKNFTHPETGEPLTREVDTLDTFVCSSWYYLRFPNPQYSKAAFDPEAVKEWLPVDIYMGGAEHAVLHLLYARFFTKVLFDEGLVDFSEPFQSLYNQGMILGPDHNKMSKSKGNVINPDDVIKEYGADTLRVYELFMAPFDVEKPWSTQSIVGVRRFLDRFWKAQEQLEDREPTANEYDVIHRLIKKVTDDITQFHFNTAIAAMMETLNGLTTQDTIARSVYIQFNQLLNPFAPHITEEIWELQGGVGYCSVSQWPVYKEAYFLVKEFEYPVQINGKVRYKVSAAADAPEFVVMQAVLAHPKAEEWIKKSPIIKQIVVPGRLVSLVI